MEAIKREAKEHLRRDREQRQERGQDLDDDGLDV